MNIEINIKAPELAEAITRLADALRKPTFTMTAPAQAAKVEGGEIIIPKGTDLTVTGVKSAEPEKPKSRKRAAAKASETQQEAPVEPEAPQPEMVAAAPEKPAESKQSSVTIEQIATAGANLLEADEEAMPKLLALLDEYGVQAITHLKPEQLPGFAERLRQIGAEV